MNIDQLNNADQRRVANASMAVIDAIQDFHPHEQIAAISAVFSLLGDYRQVTPQKALEVATNLMNDAVGKRPEFAAVRDYMEGEL